MEYAVDANVFIQAHRLYYKFGIVPGFWSSMCWQHGAGTVCSVDRIRDELLVHGDALSDWTQNTIPAAYFQSTDDAAVIDCYGQLMNWAAAEAQYTDAAKAEFAAKADAWLIAYAYAKNLTVVTMEVESRDAKRRIPIPNVVRAFGGRCVDTFTMLGALNVYYDWTAPPPA